MSTAKCQSAHLSGLSTEVITIEVDISNGLNAVSIVGLGDRAVEEAKDRISAAIKNSGFTSPKQKNQKVVISLAPADVRKEGPSFDLGMAITYLAAAGEIPAPAPHMLFLGELSLDGELRRVSGVLPILCQAGRLGFTTIFIPEANAGEAIRVGNVDIYPVSTLLQLTDHLKGTFPMKPRSEHTTKLRRADARDTDAAFDFALIRGNESAKRVLEIAAAGGHNILMYGPPGTGKTMLARSFSTIVPSLSRAESIEVTGIYSAARMLDSQNGLMTDPPFRAPHHTASYTAIVGGGGIPRPGEITLAHRGVLFLDEFPEFDRDVIEALRQPLEERVITVSRAKGSTTFPAQCILIAAMNPCKCGKTRDTGCRCREHEIRQYRGKISGPVMDRMDMWLNVRTVDYKKLAARSCTSESSATVRERVARARAIQTERMKRAGLALKLNSEMSAADMSRIVVMSQVARTHLKEIAEKSSLSARSFHRITKVAQTIADLDGKPFIHKAHLLEALGYRQEIDF